MGFRTINVEDVKEDGFFIVRYMPFFKKSGVVATKVTEIYPGGFCYENLFMGIQGDFPAMWGKNES